MQKSFFCKSFKAHCHTRFQRAFAAWFCVFKEITLVCSNERNYFENANACSKRTLKTRVATRLYVAIVKEGVVGRKRKHFCISTSSSCEINAIHSDLIARSSVNFTDILRAAFCYESVLQSFLVFIVCVCNFLAKENWQKECS